jgi:hypothetical protein
MLLTLVGSFQFGCSSPTPKKVPVQPAAAPVITQFYATAPQLSPGDQELLCYGVSNAKRVWLAPPRQELSAALSRCVEVTPKENTTYTLTAEGDTAPPATKALTVTMGMPHVKIIDVTVSALSVKAGDAVSLCYNVHFAQSVTIAPINFHAGAANHGCTMVEPRKTTTYTVSATGPSGDKDQQPVTVTVR